MMLEELRHIAAERSSTRRVELMRRLIDVYFEAPDGFSQAESFLFNEILETIIDSLPLDSRIAAAADLSVVPGLPSPLVRRLANDSAIDVARPIIRSSPVLSETDLVDLARRGSQAHLAAIASRTTVSENVTDILIERGDREVVHTVAGNHGARFSPHGLDGLLEKARQDVDLRSVLIDRPDLSQSAVDKLLPFIAEGLMLKLMERGYDVSGSLPASTIALTREKFAETLKERSRHMRDVTTLVTLIRAGEATLDAALCELADAERLLDASTALADIAGLDRAYMFNLASTGDLHTVMVVFRALDLPWPTLVKVVTLRAKKKLPPCAIGPDAQKDYAAISPTLAQRALRFIKARRVVLETAEKSAVSPRALNAAE